MRYKIRVESDYLRADLFNRETAEETREFLVAVGAEARRHRIRQVLIAVHASRTIFKIGQYGVLDYFVELGRLSRYRIALTADSDELRFAQQYIESLARQRGINVRCFRNELTALGWFRDRRWVPERRRSQEWYPGPDRRRQPRRREPGRAHAG
jgi:hypothetical protein